ncbi:MAG: hypothetical protein ACE14L_08415 [Terriglobales bacterium]
MAEILTSWKDIAQYLGKGVRTVQRWERELGLPVRRPKPGQKHIIIAFRNEVDAWLRNEAQAAVAVGTRSLQMERMRALMATMVEQTEKLRQNIEVLAKSAARHTARSTATKMERERPGDEAARRGDGGKSESTG